MQGQSPPKIYNQQKIILMVWPPDLSSSATKGQITPQLIQHINALQGDEHTRHNKDTIREMNEMIQRSQYRSYYVKYVWINQ